MLTLSALFRRSFAFGVTGALAAIFTLNAAAAITLVTPQMRLAQVGEVFVDNLTVTSTALLSAVVVNGLPAGITATQNSKGDIAFAGSPTGEGNYAISIAASNVAGESQTFSTTLVVYGVLTGVTKIVGADGRGDAPFYCALADGGVRCWGNNSLSQLGNGNTNFAIAAEQIIAPKSGVTQIAAGGSFACAVINAGVQCWGSLLSNAANNLANTKISRPTQVIPFGSSVTDVSITTSGSEACAVVAGGVQCWVSNGRTFSPEFPDVGGNGVRKLLQRIPSGSGVTKLRVAGSVTCAVLIGTLQCWGGIFPISSDDPTQITEDVVLGGASGANYFCIAANGGVRCQNDFSARAIGIPSNQLYQVIPEKSGVNQLFGGSDGACALVKGALWCWGYLPQLPFKSNVPFIARPATENISDIAFTRSSVCIVANEKPRCYGYGGGELGNRSGAINSNLSSVIAAGNNIADAAMDAGQACIVKNGGVFCSGVFALSAAATLDSASLAKAVIAEGSGATKISMKSSINAANKQVVSYCAVVDGGLQCWGDNTSGTLGLVQDANIDNAVPAQVIPAGSGVTAVAVSSSHSCAIVDGGLQCWGTELGLVVSNRYAPLLESSSEVLQRVPRWVFGFSTGVTAVATGPWYTCAVKGGGVYCWGRNFFNSFNDVAQAASARAVEVISPLNQVVGMSDYLDPRWGIIGRSDPILDAMEVPYSGNRICALKSDGEVFCWGGLREGQCGFGQFSCAKGTRTGRVVVPAGSGIASITNSCGIGNGQLKCWNSLVPGAVAVSPLGIGITTLAQTDNPYGKLDRAGQTWPCAITGGGLSCFFADGAFPRPVSTEYFAATSVSTLPDDTPNRKPWYRVVGVPDEVFVLTNNPTEYAALVFDKMRYVAQGYVFSVPSKASNVNGITAWPLYRLYREDSKLPIWTANFAEYQAMRTNLAVFRDDGIDGYVYKQAGVAGTVPLYRFKRRGSVQELLVTNPNEVQYLRNASHWELLRDVDGNSDAIGYVWPAQ